MKRLTLAIFIGALFAAPLHSEEPAAPGTLPFDLPVPTPQAAAAEAEAAQSASEAAAANEMQSGAAPLTENV
ncbi:hypothetical protein, partial [Franconibacter helveticus]